MKTKKTDIIMQNKVFTYIAGGTAAILSIPLIMMQFGSSIGSEGWDWKLGDFIFMGILLFGAGSIFVLVARVTPRKYRALIGAAFVLAVLLIWAHLAVGIIDNAPFAGS